MENIENQQEVVPVEKKPKKILRKLSEPQKILIAKMLGEFTPVDQIVTTFKEKFHISLSPQAVYAYKGTNGKKWQEIMLKARQEYVSRLEDVAGYHKRVRLERMDKVINKAENKDDFKSLITATEQQRKEVEGGEERLSSLTVYLQQLNIMSDDDLNKELETTKDYILKLAEKKKIVEIKNGEENLHV